MDTIVIEHVKVSELPEAWRAKLGAAREDCVTVRIETETEASGAKAPEAGEENPLFGCGATARIWPMSKPTCASCAPRASDPAR